MKEPGDVYPRGPAGQGRRQQTAPPGSSLDIRAFEKLPQVGDTQSWATSQGTHWTALSVPARTGGAGQEQAPPHQDGGLSEGTSLQGRLRRQSPQADRGRAKHPREGASEEAQWTQEMLGQP